MIFLPQYVGISVIYIQGNKKLFLKMYANQLRRVQNKYDYMLLMRALLYQERHAKSPNLQQQEKLLYYSARREAQE